MPKRTDISSMLIIGAGAIVIGQAAELDYSGTQDAAITPSPQRGEGWGEGARRLRVISTAAHPRPNLPLQEASPGPQDSVYLFGKFVESLRD
jgi:hypothetical protein